MSVLLLEDDGELSARSGPHGGDGRDPGVTSATVTRDRRRGRAERRVARPATATRSGGRRHDDAADDGDATAIDTPYLVDVMSPGQTWQFRLLVAGWLLSLVWFWSWWLADEHVVTLGGMAVNSLMLLWTTVLPAWYFFFVHRMKRPNRRLALPIGGVAMIVTKAPSEPWPLVRRTLEAMLAQRYPRPYDVWLADEDPGSETRRWCAEHHVRISCRKGIPGYQNTTWPGREKCKEGNLKYFYDTWGYSRYDFVVQLDADHEPEPGYLVEMIRPFNDPTVGYVAAPSLCDRNAHESWAARGRLFAEATLHGSLQAGYHGGFAPLCIGSHYAVRTVALLLAGGLGPELAEDHTTTLMLNAAGWRGAFAFDAVAHGDGPTTLADCVTQEFQWSRSLTNVLLTITPRLWARLTPRLKVQFVFAQLWYPLFATHLLVASAFPLVALTSGTPWVNVSLLEFVSRSSMVSLSCVALALWIQHQGWLRPGDARLISWETVLFQLVRWPWILLGVCHATLGWAIGKEFAFTVTPKGDEGVKRLPWQLSLPHVAIVGAQAVTALVVSDAGEAKGYYYFALLYATTYLAVVIAIVALHAHESRRQLAPTIGGLARTVGHGVVTATVATLLVGAAFGLRGTDALAAITSADGPARAQEEPGMAHAREILLRAAAAVHGAPSPVALRSAPSVALPTVMSDPAGIPPKVTPPTATPPTVDPTELPTVAIAPAGVASQTGTPVPARVDGVSEPTEAVGPLPRSVEVLSTRVAPRDLPTSGVIVGAYDPWARYTDLPLGLEHWFIRQDEPELVVGVLAHARNERTALVTIEPFPARRQRTPVLDDVVAGKTDGQLRRIGQIIRDNRPQVVLVRWGHEMDLSGLYPWSANDPALYRAAFRRVASILREEGATNARLVWSPLANGDEAAAFYPGDDVVDYVGLTVLGDEAWDTGWGLPPQSFRDLIGPKYARVAGFGKPIVAAELGVSGTSERQTVWLARVTADLAEFPLVRAVSYFNDKNPPINRLPVQPDWRLDSSLFARFVAGTQ